jgi:hypothetical protein
MEIKTMQRKMKQKWKPSYKRIMTQVLHRLDAAVEAGNADDALDWASIFKTVMDGVESFTAVDAYHEASSSSHSCIPKQEELDEPEENQTNT